MPGQHRRHPLHTVILILTAGIGLLTCIALLAVVTAMLALYLLTWL